MAVSDPHTRLAALEAAEALRNLAADYATAVDARDLDGLRRVFAPEAVMRAPGRHWDGIEAIVSFFDDDFRARPVARRHFVTNVRITDAAQGEAAARSSFLYFSASGDIPILGWGTYVDRVAEVAGRWVIVEKDIVVQHSGPLEEGWAERLGADTSTDG